jgi:ketosteroid isomerase-like protein
MAADSDVIRKILERWAETTRKGRLDEVLKNHDKDVLIYDVLAPMKYEGAEAYRASWGEWHPETPADGVFELQDLAITAGEDVAFAHGLLQCGGTMPDGKVFSDMVRATFCLKKIDGGWKVTHQHISKPLG